uniref:Tyrosine-protein kinase n=1 Tax=Panagrellus redivivus TaxID=6233 RepID=A0A7E4UZN4_PANRE
MSNNKMEEESNKQISTRTAMMPCGTTTTSTTIFESAAYHGLLPREDVQHLLKTEGDYLLRVSQPNMKSDSRQLIISTLIDKGATWNVGIRHVVIHRKSTGKYFINESTDFDSVEALLDHYKSTQTPLLTNVSNCIIKTPVPREKWELHHSDIELTKRLGQGQFGEVHRGKMKKKGRVQDIAVKLAKSSAVTKELIKEMMKEARMMRSYNHPNVVRIYGVALDDDPIMIVMELVKGGSLIDYLVRHAGKTTDAERMNNMISGSAWGLEYLHSRKCIHRDIASRNCLYDQNKNIKISDFGLSREGDSYKMTVARRVPIKWMAPEILRHFIYTRMSDVFSYGVMIWEIFSDGKEPFEEKKTAEVKQLLLNGSRLEFPAGTPVEIKDLVTKHLWCEDPKERIKMPEVVSRLEQITGVKQPPRPPRPDHDHKKEPKEKEAKDGSTRHHHGHGSSHHHHKEREASKTTVKTVDPTMATVVDGPNEKGPIESTTKVRRKSSRQTAAPQSKYARNVTSAGVSSSRAPSPD